MKFSLNTLPVLWARVENAVISLGVGDFLFVVGRILSVVKFLLYTTTALRKNKENCISWISEC